MSDGTHVKPHEASSDIKLVIALPTAGLVRVECCYSLVGMCSLLSAQGLRSRPEASVQVRLDVIQSSVIHTNREKLVRRALDSGDTHILFVDDDIQFDPRALDSLFSRRHPVVATNYTMKSDEKAFVAVGLDGKRIETTEDSTGIVPIAYSGFGFSLFETRVFVTTPQPWFQPFFVPEKSEYSTEDNPCYEAIRKAGFQPYLDQDASRMIGHMGTRCFSWQDKGK